MNTTTAPRTLAGDIRRARTALFERTAHSETFAVTAYGALCFLAGTVLALAVTL